MYALTATMPLNKITRVAQQVGPTGSLKKDGFTRCFKHWRFCYNNRCDPPDHEPPSSRHALVAQTWKGIMKGDSASQQAVQILGKSCIAIILDVNQYGLRSNPLDGHLPHANRTRHLYDCMWNVLNVTLEAREKLGKDRYNVVSKSLEFCRVIYGSQYSKLVILILYVCQDCGHAPAHDFDWWCIAGGDLKGWYCAKCGCKFGTDPMSGALVVLHREHRELSFTRKIEIPKGKP